MDKEILNHIQKAQSNKAFQAQARTMMHRILTNTAQHPCPFCGWQPRAGILTPKSLSKDLVLPKAAICPIHKAFQAQRDAMERLADFANGHVPVVDRAEEIVALFEDTSKALGLQHDANVLGKMNGSDTEAWAQQFYKLFYERRERLEEAVKELHALHAALPPQFKGVDPEQENDTATEDAS